MYNRDITIYWIDDLMSWRIIIVSLVFGGLTAWPTLGYPPGGPSLHG